MHFPSEDSVVVDGDKKPKAREQSKSKSDNGELSNRTLQDANTKPPAGKKIGEIKYRSVAHIQDYDPVARERKHKSKHGHGHKSSSSLRSGEFRKHNKKRDPSEIRRVRSSNGSSRTNSSDSISLHSEGDLKQRSRSESSDLLAKARIMRMEASSGRMKLPPGNGRERSTSHDERKGSNQSRGHERRRTHEGYGEHRRSRSSHDHRKQSGRASQDDNDRREADRDIVKRKSSSSVSHGGERDHDREMRKLRAKARSIRKRSTTQNQLLQEAVDNNNKRKSKPASIDRTRHSQDGSETTTREPSLARSTSESSLKLDDIFRTENATSYSNSTTDFSESQESVLDRMSASLSSLSTYFESFKLSHSKSDLATLDGSRTNADTRHLLYIGQQSSELQKAQMVLEDKDEWRKLQLEMKQKGVITNQGARQVLNPLLEKSEKERTEAEKEKRKPPPVIFIDDLTLSNSENSSVK